MTTAKHRFFCASPNTGILDEDESAHAIRVLRLQAGDAIELLNGKGERYLATITETTKRQVSFELVTAHRQPVQTPAIHIAIAPTKNIDRFEFFLEKATEIGLATIHPVLTKNSERKEIKIEKLTKNLVAAMKQSGNLFLPDLAPLRTFKDFLAGQTDPGAQKFIAHCEEDPTKNQLFNLVKPAKNVVILIGPEGDFTPEEIALAKRAGFLPVSLGETRLRTETAGIVACLTVHLKQSSFH